MTPETLRFTRTELISDGASGFLPGAPMSYTCTGEVTTKESIRVVEGGQLSLRSGYKLLIWKDSRYVPQVGDSVTVRGEQGSIQTVRVPDDLQTRYLITVLQQVNG